ncbi:hypothetical protein [Agromyces sp. NPDC058126]|uniref:hypothetical protein n=1 Tax=Agromyces sp. NPDC058126 TaxID=3346350 RepID=UPI0036DAF4BF
MSTTHEQGETMITDNLPPVAAAAAAYETGVTWRAEIAGRLNAEDPVLAANAATELAVAEARDGARTAELYEHVSDPSWAPNGPDDLAHLIESVEIYGRWQDISGPITSTIQEIDTVYADRSDTDAYPAWDGEKVSLRGVREDTLLTFSESREAAVAAWQITRHQLQILRTQADIVARQESNEQREAWKTQTATFPQSAASSLTGPVPSPARTAVPTPSSSVELSR